jgi:nucleotide-binding universal stress UspA family protein
MFQRIVVALDSGDAGAVATSYAVSLARSGRADVRLVHVHAHVLGRRGTRAESLSEAVDVVAAALSEMQSADIRANGVTYRTSVFDVASTIAEVAEAWHADVIVTGSRRRRIALPFRRGVRERLTRCTSLPVLTAPAPLRLGRRGKELQGPALTRHQGSSVTS